MTLPDIEARYALTGPQVAPEAAQWAQQVRLRVLDEATIHHLAQSVPRYPDDSAVVTDEIRFLNFLAAGDQRTGLLLQNQTAVQQQWDVLVAAHGIPGADRPVAPLSRFLRRDLADWQTPDAVTDRDPGAEPPTLDVVNTGAGLARYFQDETPGLAHRLAVNFLIQEHRTAAANGGSRRVPSPPAQALIWAALDVAIASALLAAWYVKWVFDPTAGSESRHARRPRPVEPPVFLDRDTSRVPLNSVLYDRFPPPGTAGLASPGTPRHPAYPSGHSTYAAAASRVLAAFFPRHGKDFEDLADNIGMARLWAGVHWPSDHTAGRALGEAVGDQVLRQITVGSTHTVIQDQEPPATEPPPVVAARSLAGTPGQA